MLDFSGPVNFLGPPPEAVKAVKQNSRLIRFYPDPDPVEFRKENAAYVRHGVSPENIILGNGSIELIYMITGIVLPNFQALIPVPSFSEYEKAVLRVGGEAIFVKLPNDFELDVESIKQEATEDTRIIYICNPHSPSGTLYKQDTLLDLTEFGQKRGIIVSIDENYIEFSSKGQESTLVGFVNEYDNLFVIRSVTKFYGMPGIRLGYGIAAKKVIDMLQIIRQPWSINSLAGWAALAAIKDKEFIESTKRTIVKEKSKFAQMLTEIGGLQVFPSETNFLLVKILESKLTSTALREKLAEKGLLIRDCSTFVGLDNNYFRVTVRSADDNTKLVKILEQILCENVN